MFRVQQDEGFADGHLKYTAGRVDHPKMGSMDMGKHK